LTTPFVVPVNPGASATIPRAAASPAIIVLNRAHDAATHLFNQYDSADKALKQQIIGAIDATYLKTLRSKYVGFQNRSTRDILDHLYSTYANISASQLLENDTQMKTSYGANQPIELFFDQIEDAVDFADAGESPYTPVQVTNIAYQLVFQTGLLPDECKLWKRRSVANKTWDAFKTEFALAHQELRETQLTTGSTGFHSANSATVLQHETADAIANLATATTADRQTVAALTATISQLTLELSAANTKLLAKATQQTNRNSGGGTPRRQRNPGPHYCFTHGSKVHHTSLDCKYKGPGHKDCATEENKMGGSTKTFTA
jgi:hypothetical protein